VVDNGDISNVVQMAGRGWPVGQAMGVSLCSPTVFFVPCSIHLSCGPQLPRILLKSLWFWPIPAA
jgi:hypothetical protein